MAAHFLRWLWVGCLRRRGLIAGGIAVVIVVLLANSFAIPIVRASLLAPNELLNADGTLNLTTGKAGTVDVRGWNVQLDPQRGPVLAPNAPNAPNAPTSDGWSALGNGLSGGVYAMAISGNDVYVGGLFSQICGNSTCDSGDIRVNNIARWDGSHWSPLGLGFNNGVYGIALGGGMVYVGGDFTILCSNEACDAGSGMSHVGEWDGSAWYGLGYGVDSTVLTVAASGSDIYFGGDFTNLCGDFGCSTGNTSAYRIAKWSSTSSSWSTLKNGVSGSVRAIAIDGSNVYAGGLFVYTCGDSQCLIGNNRVNYVAKWDGSNWFALGNGFNKFALALAVNGGVVYAGGQFIQVCGVYTCDSGNVTVNHIAQWNGSSWSGVDTGLNVTVNVIVPNGTGLDVGGAFTAICGDLTCSGGKAAQGIAHWDGIRWTTFDYGVNNFVFALAPIAGQVLYAGGKFQELCGNSSCTNANRKANYVAVYGPQTPTPTRTSTPTITPTRTRTLTPTLTPTTACLAKPAKVTLIAPPNGAVRSNPQVKLKWSDVTCETQYQVRVRNTATGKVAFKANLGADVGKVKTTTLAKGVTYKWFVKGCNGFGCTKSAGRTFTVS